jgi:hypothetical protein
MKPTKASAGHSHSPDEMHNDDVAHEHSDVNISALVWSMVVMFGVVIGTAVLMYALFFFVLEKQALARDPKLSPLALPATTMPTTTTGSPFFGGAPEPRLMTNEPSNLLDYRTREHERLTGAGKVDQPGGFTHIPIDRAKRLTLERGLAVRADPLTDERLGTRLPAAGESSAGRAITR